MSIIQQAAPTAPKLDPSLHWRPVILSGPYLRRMRCKLALDEQGNVVDCDRIHSIALSGTPKFWPWFVHLYHPIFLADSFGMSHLSGPAQRPDAERDNGE